jgi:hypothetical protein
MSGITTKTRKIIWSLSGDRCAICKQELTKKVDEEHLILGQECHIRSKKVNGPRYDVNFPKEKLNLPGNIILLCRNHHKEIDDFSNKYTVLVLENVKTKHELEIKNSTSQRVSSPKIIEKSKYLEALHITSGMQLVTMASDTCGYGYAFDETKDDETYELIKDFLSYVEDLDVILDIGEAGKLDMAKEIQKIIEALEGKGYFVFGTVANDTITGGVGADAPWRTLYFTLTTNKEIKYIVR